MLKLILCLIFAVGTGVVLLELRQQHLKLTFETNELHNRIQATQAQLWNQQLSIAVATAPNVIAAQIKEQDAQSTAPSDPVSTSDSTPGSTPAAPHSWVEDQNASAGE